MPNFGNTVKVFKEIHPQFILLFQFGNFYRAYGRDALIMAYIFNYQLNEVQNMKDNEKFKIINLVKNLIVQIDRNLVNFPKKEIELKREIKTTSYNLLLLTYEANNTDNKERKHELQERTVAYVKYLNFFFNLCYDKQIIKKSS